MNKWGKFWACWAGVGAVAEGVALAKPSKGDTLSEQFWALRNRLSPESYSLILSIMAGLAAWLIRHFAVEGRHSD